MNNSHAMSQKHGLTVRQWFVLFAAFMVGLGGSFALRGIFPPSSSAHASVIQPAQTHFDIGK